MGLGVIGLVGLLAAALWAEESFGLRCHETKYYRLYSNDDRENVLELAARMTRMFEEYARRSRGFKVRQLDKLPCYFFETKQDYVRAGGLAESAGGFSPRHGLMIPSDGRRPRQLATVLQHEAFHQFAEYVISKDMPIWINEGLATYFERAIWTGDGFVTGIVPPGDPEMVLEMFEEDRMHSFSAMVRMTSRQWKAGMRDPGSRNYTQVWSMTHFLMHAEDGKYAKVLDRYLSSIHAGKREQADTFIESLKGLEDDYVQWWHDMTLDASRRHECEAVVATLGSFLGRAQGQGQTFADPNEFVEAVAADEVKIPSSKTTQWLPTSLLTDALHRLSKLTSADVGPMRPVRWRIEPDRRTPKLVMICADDSSVTAEVTVRGGHVHDVQVTYDEASNGGEGTVPIKLAAVSAPDNEDEIVDFIYVVMGRRILMVRGDAAGTTTRTEAGEVRIPNPGDPGRVTIRNPYDNTRLNIPKELLGQKIPTVDDRTFVAKLPGDVDTEETPAP